MSKKHFIALAQAIMEHNQRSIARRENIGFQFQEHHIDTLCDLCKSQNGRFDRERFRGYIAGECGPNGGSLRSGGSR